MSEIISNLSEREIKEILNKIKQIEKSYLKNGNIKVTPSDLLNMMKLEWFLVNDLERRSLRI